VLPLVTLLELRPLVVKPIVNVLVAPPVVAAV
jgi:hypothetical protein